MRQRIQVPKHIQQSQISENIPGYHEITIEFLKSSFQLFASRTLQIVSREVPTIETQLTIEIMSSLGINNSGNIIPYPNFVWHNPLITAQQQVQPFFGFYGIVPKFESYPIFQIERNEEVQPAEVQQILEQTPEIAEQTEYNRKSKSLEELSKRVLNYFGSAKNVQFGLEVIIKDLNVERRRVYDIINIYQSLDIVKRLARKNYLWNGLGHFVTKLELLMEKTSNPCNEPSQVHRPFEELTTDFIIFMSQSKSSTSLENAAEQFEENFGTAAKKTFKTKVRRLYDITNVLMSLGIVRKVRRNNRQEFQWIGLEGFNAQQKRQTITSVLQTIQIPPSFFRESVITNGLQPNSTQELHNFIQNWRSSMWETVHTKKNEKTIASFNDQSSANGFTLSRNLKEITNMSPNIGFSLKQPDNNSD